VSHHGIGILFTPGVGGSPEVMVIRDVEAHCSVCGRVAYQRRYVPVPYHPMNARALRALVDATPAGFEEACEQCGAVVTTDDVSRWMLAYGFPGLRGVICARARRGGEIAWSLEPHTRADVQRVPVWDPAPDQSVVDTWTLDDDVAIASFERVISGKGALRRMLRERAHASLPSDAFEMATLADGLAVIFIPASEGATSADAEAWLTNASPPDPGERWTVCPLRIDGVLAKRYPACPAEWLAGFENVAPAWDVFGAASSAPIISAIERVLATFPIQIELRDHGAGSYGLVPPDTHVDEAPRFDVSSIAEEAARTLIPPEEAAHLEVDRVLHVLAGWWEDDELDGLDSHGASVTASRPHSALPVAAGAEISQNGSGK